MTNYNHDDPHVLVAWVKQIVRLSWAFRGQPHHLLHHPDQPDGVDALPFLSAAEVHMISKQRQWKAGIWFIATAIALPIATYGAMNVWLANASARSPAPDQGAMLMAFFALCGSVAIAAVVLGTGVALLVRSRTPRG